MQKPKNGRFSPRCATRGRKKEKQHMPLFKKVLLRRSFSELDWRYNRRGIDFSKVYSWQRWLTLEPAVMRGSPLNPVSALASIWAQLITARQAWEGLIRTNLQGWKICTAYSKNSPKKTPKKTSWIIQLSVQQSRPHSRRCEAVKVQV